MANSTICELISNDYDWRLLTQKGDSFPYCLFESSDQHECRKQCAAVPRKRCERRHGVVLKRLRRGDDDLDLSTVGLSEEGMYMRQPASIDRPQRI
jgi:hypothetical protein